MKKLLTMFALTAASAAFSGCGNGLSDKDVITLNQQAANKTLAVTSSPCRIEVPLNEPALNDYNNKIKYYDFCDSTVVISASSGVYGGPVFSKRPFDELKGAEKTEMQRAGKVYEQKMGLGK